jgi:CO/xanthine dehydrogenase Mo-binding subunit
MLAATVRRAVGHSIPRIDVEPKLRGEAVYGADVRLPGMLRAAILSSPYARAEILSIDTAAAIALPGVEAIITGADIPDVPSFDPASRVHAFLARGHAVYAGQPVAAIAARDVETAESALALIEVDYRPLSPVASIAAALAADAPSVIEPAPSRDTGNVDHRYLIEHGDLAAAFDISEAVVERTYRIPMIHHGYIEPQVVTAHWDRHDHVTIWATTQTTFEDRDVIASVLGLSPTQIVVNGTEIGGGFGGKYHSPILPLTVLLARQARRSVQLVLSRQQEFATTKPAPAMEARVKVGARRDGRLLALDASIAVDVGAFRNDDHVSDEIAVGIRDTYNFEAWRVEAVEVLTNKVSTGPYRAPGGAHGAFAIETHMDEVARALGIDRAELRKQNLTREGDLGYQAKPHGPVTTDAILATLTGHSSWTSAATSRPDGWLRGRGLAIATWGSSAWPAAAQAVLEADGRIRLNVGTVDLTGAFTAFTQIAAEALGVARERLFVTKSNTDQAPFAPVSGGSRTIYSMGAAIEAAAIDLRDKIVRRASDLLEVAPGDIEVRDGGLTVVGTPSKGVSWLDLYRSGADVFSAVGAPLVGLGTTLGQGSDPISVGTIAEVAVDPETGVVKVERMVTAQDVGRAINPALIEGQIHGGAAQAIGMALTEGIRHDEAGQNQTTDFGAYRLPRSTTVPPIEAILVEEPGHGPFGAKGVGEPPIITPPAAIANAVADAIGRPVTELPLTPDRVWHLLHDRDEESDPAP